MMITNLIKLRHLFITVLSIALITPAVIAQTLYEREITLQEKQRYQLTYWDEILNEEKSEEQLRKDLLATNWSQDWTIVKVELLKTKNNTALFSRTSSLGMDQLRVEKESQWSATAKQRLFLGKPNLQLDVNGNMQTFETYQRDLGFDDDPLSIYLPDEEFTGRAVENFRSADGFEFSTTVVEPLTGEMLVHEFLRLIMPYKLSLTQSKLGPVILFSNPNPTLMTTDPTTECCIKGIAWISGNKLAVYITTNGVNPIDAAVQYAEKFSSSLSPTIKLEKNNWAMNEIEQGLQRLDSAVKNKPLGPVDWYVFHLNRLVSHVYFPFPTLTTAYTSDKNGREELIRTIKDWTTNNKNNLHWDESRAMYVAKE